MRRLVAVVVIAVAACTSAPAGSNDPDASQTLDPVEAASGSEALDVLRRALTAGDDAAAAAVTDVTQLPLVALADGADADLVAALTAAELQAVGVNFWAGFRERFELVAGLDAGALEVRDTTVRDVEGVQFAAGDFVNRVDGSGRTIVVRDVDGQWVVDLVATFPSPLLLAVPESVAESMRRGQAELVDALRALEPSIRWVLTSESVEPDLEQAAIAALQAIGA